MRNMSSARGLATAERVFYYACGGITRVRTDGSASGEMILMQGDARIEGFAAKVFSRFKGTYR